MIAALALLLGCQLAGEIMVRALALPLPGPVAGLALLFGFLVWRGRRHANAVARIPEDLSKVGDTLLANLSLLFVPAAVGVIKYLHVLRDAALPIAATIAISTLLALAVTAVTFHVVSRLHPFRRRPLADDIVAPAAFDDEARG